MSLHKIEEGLWVHPDEITAVRTRTVELSGLKAKKVHMAITSCRGGLSHSDEFGTLEEARAHADVLAEKINALTKLPESLVQGIGKAARPTLWKADCETGEVQPVPAHQARVYEEKSELDSRRERLALFIDRSPLFPDLPEAERDRLREQRRLMGDYSAILGGRIAAF